MATTSLRPESVPANVTVADIRQAAAALRRLNEIDSAPVLSLDDRAEVFRAKAICWSVVGSAAEALVSLMDAIAGDPDVEPNGDELDGDGGEDDFMEHPGDLPGCPIADPAEYAAPEGVRHREYMGSLPHEDFEDDDPAEDEHDREEDRM